MAVTDMSNELPKDVFVPLVVLLRLTGAWRLEKVEPEVEECLGAPPYACEKDELAVVCSWL